MLDYHVHLWPHASRAEPAEQRLEHLSSLCDVASSRGVAEIALTEHLFRFVEARKLLDGALEDVIGQPLEPAMAAYFAHHATASLESYVEAVLEARREGLPIRLGLEVDYYPGRMAEVARLLEGYPFDVLLGSVHWLGSWMFDVLEDPLELLEWDRLGAEVAWRRYTEALVELAATRTCDVLAHPDLVKLTGRRPPAALVEELEARIAEAVARSGMSAEISSAGWRKPCGEAYPSVSLLGRLFALGVPVTTASDSHGPHDVADRAPELVVLARAAGYRHLRAFSERMPRDVLLPS